MDGLSKLGQSRMHFFKSMDMMPIFGIMYPTLCVCTKLRELLGIQGFDVEDASTLVK